MQYVQITEDELLGPFIHMIKFVGHKLTYETASELSSVDTGSSILLICFRYMMYKTITSDVIMEELFHTLLYS
jgi:hypothetical protein